MKPGAWLLILAVALLGTTAEEEATVQASPLGGPPLGFLDGVQVAIHPLVRGAYQDLAVEARRGGAEDHN